MKIGLLFGSFNPIHNGHISIAGFMVEYCDLNEIWFVVSPQNPLKNKSDLAPDKQRLEMVKLAIEDFYPKISVCDIEMLLPRPSYTIDTLKLLVEKYPQNEFSVIMGSDSIESITQWKDYQTLLDRFHILVYPRLGSDIEMIKEKYSVDIVSAPIIELSSTFIRRSISLGKNVKYYLPLKAYNYLIQNKVYSNL
jgi:nicotinate-nucleotide adenylyltransferase